MIFFGVTGFLAGVIDLILFQVSVIDIVSSHAEGLGKGYQEMEEVDDFDASILFIKFLIFRPPFPRDTVDEFRHFLRHGTGVVKHPLGFFFLREIFEINANAFI